MIESLEGFAPQIDPTALVHPSAHLSGRIVIGRQASIWPGVVLRGDIEKIVIGDFSNVQDNSIAHTAKGLPTLVGNYVTIGHGVIFHACRIGDLCLIGMGSIILNGAVIEPECLIGAGALVPEGRVIPSGSLALGMPARVVRALTKEERTALRESAENYLRYSDIWRRTAKPVP